LSTIGSSMIGPLVRRDTHHVGANISIVGARIDVVEARRERHRHGYDYNRGAQQVANTQRGGRPSGISFRCHRQMRLRQMRLKKISHTIQPVSTIKHG
jgi:hypothetical protein